MQDNNYPRNLVIDSFFELELSWDEDITLDIVNNAFISFLKLYIKLQESGVQPTFTITQKEKAKDFLIQFFKLI